MLNKSKGNMYGFVTHTWNPIKGKCPHECSYCYMTKMYKRYKWDETLRLDGKCLNDNLGKGNFIFVGSSTDMFADIIPRSWIDEVFDYCRKYNSTTYLFQSKNPEMFLEYKSKVSDELPGKIIFATTLESNINHIHNQKLPTIQSRVNAMCGIKLLTNIPTTITIEPIMQFDIKPFLEMLIEINPSQVNIGADSGNNKLPEPPKEKIEELIKKVKKFTTVHLKDNLKRLL